MNGKGSVVYHDPDFGDYLMGLDIEWTIRDKLGRVTEGKIDNTDEGHDVLMEVTVNIKRATQRVAFQYVSDLIDLLFTTYQ